MPSARMDAPRPTLVLDDEGPVASLLRLELAGRGYPTASLAEALTGGVDGSQVRVIVANHGEFARVINRRPAERRARTAERVAAGLADASGAGGLVEHVIVISSAQVCGAWAQRPPIEDGDPIVTEDEEGLAGDLVAVEQQVSRWAEQTGTIGRVAVLRPSPLVGPGIDSMFTRHFEAPRLLVVRGAQRDWQMLHITDLASAIEVVERHRLAGPLTVGAMKTGPDGTSVPDAVTGGEVMRIAHMRPIELSEGFAFGTAERLHRTGVLPAPASDLPYVVFPWNVEPRTLLQHGWFSEVSSAECIRQVALQTRGALAVAGRGLRGMTAAAVGAAGAAVAIVGTAARMRQSRGGR